MSTIVEESGAGHGDRATNERTGGLGGWHEGDLTLLSMSIEYQHRLGP